MSYHVSKHYASSAPTIHEHVRLVDLPQALYQQGYGAVLDSGTTFTYLPTQAFTAFTQEVSKYALAHGLRSVKGPDKNVIPLTGHIA